MMDDPFQKNREIHNEADDILASGLRAILAECGEVCPIGSYALQTMAWRDLDICIVTDNGPSVSAFFTAGKKIARLLPVHRMRFQNERIAKTPNLPEALCWAVYLGDERAGAWKFDLWGVNREQYMRFYEYNQSFAERMTDKKRRVIIGIKSQVFPLIEYRRDFESGDIYRAVLDHDVLDLDGFKEYIWKVKKLQL